MKEEVNKYDDVDENKKKENIRIKREEREEDGRLMKKDKNI